MILTLSFALPVTIAESGSIQLVITLEKETHQSTQGERQRGRHTRRVCMNCCWFAFWRFPRENSTSLDSHFAALLTFGFRSTWRRADARVSCRKQVFPQRKNVFVCGVGKWCCCLLHRATIDYWGTACISDLLPILSLNMSPTLMFKCHQLHK